MQESILKYKKEGFSREFGEVGRKAINYLDEDINCRHQDIEVTRSYVQYDKETGRVYNMDGVYIGYGEVFEGTLIFRTENIEDYTKNLTLETLEGSGSKVNISKSINERINTL